MPDTQVWLPVRFASARTEAGFSEFPDKQLKEVIGHYRSIQPNLICPEPLGCREVFRWRLREALEREGNDQSALRDFGLLMEGLAYGFLRPKTFDLQNYGFTFQADSERYITVLLYRAGPAAPESVAGLFSPHTLVCPASNWTSRNALEGSVRRFRDLQPGNYGRALLREFHNELQGAGTLWSQALDWLIREHPVTILDPGPVNQSNVGPLLLEMMPGSVPKVVFVPSYSSDRLRRIIHRLHGSSHQLASSGVSIVHNGQVLANVTIPQANRPKLFGLGAVEITNTNDLPATAGFDHSSRELFQTALAGVINPFVAEISADQHYRFSLPDVLRAVFQAMGEPSARAFLTGQGSRWIYSDRVSAASLQPQPHQAAVQPGVLYSSATDGVFFPEITLNGQVAYYVETWLGHDFGELTALGLALWQIFRARSRHLDPSTEVAKYLRITHNMIIPVPATAPAAPTAQDLLTWSNFLFWLDQQSDLLFRAAGQIFAARYSALAVTAKKRTQTQRIEIGDHAWLIAE